MNKPALSPNKPHPLISLPGDAHANIRALLQLWAHKNRFQEVPKLSDFTDQELTPFQSGMALADFDHRTESLTFLQAGDGVVQLLGRNPAGRPMLEFYRGPEWLEVWNRYNFVIEKQRPAYRRTDAYKTASRPRPVETLYLPVLADQPTVSRILTYSH